MPTIQGDAMSGMPKPEAVSHDMVAEGLLREVIQVLDDAKADDVVTIELTGKSSVADYMVVASGRSDRHVGAIADQLQRRLKEIKYGTTMRVEGQPQNDWVLIDVGDLIVHIFRPEVREFYNLEKMWMADTPEDAGAAH
jgi:ribosome-associated protein